MALTDKNIVITPNTGDASDPKIVFSSANVSTAAQNITLTTYPTSNGTLSFDGSAGQLFSITNSLSGTIFSVNDISGMPSIEVLDSGIVKLAQYWGNILVGTAYDNGNKLQVNGNMTISNTLKLVDQSIPPVERARININGTSLEFHVNETTTARLFIDSSGNVMIGAGNFWKYTPTPTTLNVGANAVTAAQLKGEIFISTSSNTVSMTLPLATDLDTYFSGAVAAGFNIGFDFYVLNNGTASFPIVISVNTGITHSGPPRRLEVDLGTMAQFRLRRTAANTYIIYRLS